MKLLKHIIFFKINFTVAPLAKQLSGLDFCLSARDLTGSMFQPQTWLRPKTQLWLNALLLYQDPQGQEFQVITGTECSRSPITNDFIFNLIRTDSEEPTL